MGFACGIVLQGGRECVHVSRREALACTRRELSLGETNKLVAELEEKVDNAQTGEKAALEVAAEAGERLQEATAELAKATKEIKALEADKERLLAAAPEEPEDG
jgi:FKBP-type peptidyl-prolyl cis-trans isomerase 2